MGVKQTKPWHTFVSSSCMLHCYKQTLQHECKDLQLFPA